MAKTLLITAIVIGAFLRLAYIGIYPPGFTPDEAAFGYNAQSLLSTGRDEWGTVWWNLPLTNLKSFGDYKLPLYAFLSVPTVKLFGLNEFATRLPNAILSVLSLLSIYLLGTRLFGKKVGIVSTVTMALSPWSIQLSRGAFEANLATLFIPLGIYAYLSRRPIISAIVFSIGMYSYHSVRFITPFVTLLLIAYSKKINWKFLFIFIILCLPGLVSLVGSGSQRASDLVIFHPTDNWESVARARFQSRLAGLPDWGARLFSNKLTYSVSLWITNYLSYFSPEFLFIKGPSETTYGMLTSQGVLYISDLAGITLFLIFLARNPSKNKLLLLSLLFLSVIPASLAKGQGYAANRAAIAIPFFCLAISIGYVYFAQLKKLFLAFSAIYLLGFIFAVHNYVVFSSYVMNDGMHVGMRELFERSISLSRNYELVKYSRTISSPHIYLAFFSKYPAKQYQEQISKYSEFQNQGFSFIDQLSEYHLGKYQFGDLYADRPVQVPTLFIGSPGELFAISNEHFHIDDLSGNTKYRVVQKIP